MPEKEKKTATESEATVRELPQAELGEMLRQLDAVKAIYAPYAATLTPAERLRYISSSVRNIGFIQAAYLSADGHQNFLPSYLPMEKFTEDKDDFERKRTLLSAIQDLEQEVSDSVYLASDIAYHDALAYYNTLKEAAKQHIAGAAVEYDALKSYFARPKQSSDQPTEAQIERDIRSLLHGTKEGKITVEKDIPATEKATLKVEDTAHSPREVIDETVVEKVKTK
jgi:hypothetical protein